MYIPEGPTSWYILFMYTRLAIRTEEREASPGRSGRFADLGLFPSSIVFHLRHALLHAFLVLLKNMQKSSRKTSTHALTRNTFHMVDYIFFIEKRILLII